MNDPASIEQKLVAWYRQPAIQAKRWAPNLFWLPANANDPFGRLRVDPAELEVLFATILGEPSECAAQLDAACNGRGSFIAVNARRHELPLLSRNDRSF